MHLLAQRAIERIRALRPKVVLVTGSRGFIVADVYGRILTGRARTEAWKRGTAWTLARLVPRVGRAIDPGRHAELALRQPGALPRSNPRHTIRCATTVSKAISYAWLNIEAAAARTGHAGFIDTEMWVCPTTPCPAIVWGRLVHRNRGHLSVSFPRTQWARLKRAILREARLISRRAGRRPASARWSVGRTGPASDDDGLDPEGDIAAQLVGDTSRPAR